MPESSDVCHCRAMVRGALVALLLLVPSARAHAQEGRLIVTVVDTSGAVVPGAKVTVTALDDGARAGAFPPLTTTDKGAATADGLLPGRYRVQGEFPGFEIGILPEIRIRRGDNKHVLVLPLKKMEESVTVAQNAQAAAADPRGNAFKTVLTRQEIENLSDDRTEMAQQLQDLAGGNATIRVDSFSGAPLPPKSMIKSIHIVRDAFAAENHSAESEGIDIITQPGQGALSGGISSRLRDGSLSARSPFVTEKGPERQATFEGNVGGTLVKGKSSFALSVEGRDAYDTPLIYVALPNGGRRSELLPLQHPTKDWSVYGLVDYALTRDQTLRIWYDQGRNTQGNLGVGGSDLIERAYSTESQDYELRAQVVGPFGRRTFANTRLQLEWLNSGRGVGDGGADGGRERRVHERRRASVGRPPPEAVRAGVRRGPRARPAHHTRRLPRDRRPLPIGQRHQPSRHLHVLERRCLRRRNGGDLYPAHRRSAHRVLQRPDRHLRPGRHPRPQEPDAESRRALRNPDAPEGPRQHRPARSARRGRRSRAAAPRSAAASACSTTG